jgi:hypothetical protein
MTHQPWEPEANNLIGALSDDAAFVGFAEPSTKHQPKNPVDKLPFDICEDVGRWNFVVCFHVEVGKCITNLQRAC